MRTILPIIAAILETFSIFSFVLAVSMRICIYYGVAFTTYADTLAIISGIILIADMLILEK